MTKGEINKNRPFPLCLRIITSQLSYISSGAQVTSCFDICNEMFYYSIGNYAYFATTAYPYITCCFGRGNYLSFKPNSTTNATASYTKSSYAFSFSNSKSSTVILTTAPSNTWFSALLMIFFNMAVIFS